jgi:hypothetical protein
VESGKRDRYDIVKLGSRADVGAIFTRARHFDFGPPFAGDPWDDRPTLGPNVSRFPSAIPAGQRGKRDKSAIGNVGKQKSRLT